MKKAFSPMSGREPALSDSDVAYGLHKRLFEAEIVMRIETGRN